MKFIALLVATASAAIGDDCFYDASVCGSSGSGIECTQWEDGQYG